jgi:ABC-type transporter Mla subunit MlaD
MAVQDLTPQLRTRLSRLEKLVGVFVTLATLLLLAGLVYYVYHTGQRKGWFLTKAPYYVYLHSGGGIKLGDTVMLMGFPVGEITEVTAARPWTYDENGKMVDVFVKFVIHDPNIGYIYNDSVVKVKSAGLLGNRFLEVTKGGTSGTTNKLYPTYVQGSKSGKLKKILIGNTGTYSNYAVGFQYGLSVDEPPDLSSQMDEMLRTAKGALPAILDMTNQLNRIMTNANAAVVHLDDLLVGAKPIVASMGTASTNLSAITGVLREGKGALGEWLLPTNIQTELVRLLPNVNSAVTNVNTNLVSLVENLNKSLENLAGITSNLHAQVEANTNILSSISTTIVDTDDLIQGLKRHWLLRSAFKPKKTESKTNATPVRPAESPRGASWR